MTWHFVALNFIPQESDHFSSAARSCYSCAWSSMLWMTRYRRQSSAKSLQHIFGSTTVGSLLMCKRKSRGPSIVPWGTPDLTSSSLERIPSQSTDCERSVRKASTHFSVEPSILWCSNFPGSIRCGMVLKALKKSKMVISICFPSSHCLRMSCVASRSSKHLHKMHERSVVGWVVAVSLLENRCNPRLFPCVR